MPDGEGGNVTELSLDSFGPNGAFGFTGWKQLDKLDQSDSQGTSGTVESDKGWFTVTYLDSFKKGTWTLNDGFSFDPANAYIFAIKGGTTDAQGKPGVTPIGNAAYLMDISMTSGTWFTDALVNPGGNTPDISNIRLFAAPIPLPPVVFMMLGALGALVVTTRRRRAAA